MIKPKLTGRAFMCVSTKENDNEVTEWSEHFTVGKSYVELSEDRDGYNFANNQDSLLLIGDHNIEIYCDISQFAFLIETSKALKRMS